MARPKQFDIDATVAAAVGVFRDHGYEGTSAQMLVDAMGIGRQSLYDTFGDKWGIYCAALRQYCQQEVSAHVTALAHAPRAIDGIRAMLERVVADAAGRWSSSAVHDPNLSASEIVSAWCSPAR